MSFSLDSAIEDSQSALASYSGTDPRLLNLSYSSLLTAHLCPRKFQLDKLQATRDTTESQSDSITFSYGHIVGLGIQMVLEHKSLDEFLWQAFLTWTPELFADNPKQNKSFAHSIYAVHKFKAMLDAGYLENYELVYYDGKPACELSFIITLPNGFKYRGFVDAVLRHKITGQVIVLECKTSSAINLNPATYKNSAQAIGYSIVLDAIFPELSAYSVIYLVYSSKELQYEQLEFKKSYLQRARWIQELVLDCEILTLYETNNLYPMHGENCVQYFRDCSYLGLCEMPDDRITSPLTQAGLEKLVIDNEKYQIKITLEDLIQTQLSKVS